MSLFSIGMILTGILISFVAVFGYCALMMARREDEAGIQPEDEAGSVAPERGALRVMRQEDQDG